MAILTKHFQVVEPESLQRVHNVPGVTGPVIKKLNTTYATIIQTGYADAGDTTDLMSGKGDPSVLVTVDALLHGEFTKCYKKNVQLDPEMTGDGGLIKYTITWEKIQA